MTPAEKLAAQVHAGAQCLLDKGVHGIAIAGNPQIAAVIVIAPPGASTMPVLDLFRQTFEAVMKAQGADIDYIVESLKNAKLPFRNAPPSDN